MDSAKKTVLAKRVLLGALVISLIVSIAYLDSQLFPTIPTRIVISLLGMLAHWEVYKMLGSVGRSRWASIGAWFGFTIFLQSALFPWSPTGGEFYKYASFILPVCLLIFCLLSLAAPIDAKRFNNPFFTAFFVPVPLSFPIRIRLNENLGALEGLLFVVAVAKIGDIFAYFVGTAIGKRKLAPEISPNKTWEGAIASAMGAVGFAAFLQHQGWAAGLSLEQALIAGLVINVFAQVSDLSKSVLKRACKVKDSATYFSVMGGALDMIDSLIFAAPAYVALRLFVY